MRIRSEYDSWHGDLEIDETADAPWHPLLQAYLQTDRDIRNKRVLESVVDAGGLASFLAAQPPRLYVAVDFSSTAIEKARAFSPNGKPPQISWEVGDIQNSAHSSNTFDGDFLRNHRTRAQPDARRRRTRPRTETSRKTICHDTKLHGRYGALSGVPSNDRPALQGSGPTDQPTHDAADNTASDSIDGDQDSGDRWHRALSSLSRSPTDCFSDRLRVITKWLALHSLVVGVKA